MWVTFHHSFSDDLTLQACQLLRKQKLHKKKSEQQQQMMDNLEQILSRIQQAETDAMVSICITSSCISCLCTFVQYVMVTPTLP